MVFEWTKTKEKAALLVADGQLSEPEIAKQLKISQRSVARWKTYPDFQVRIAEHLEAARQAIRDKGISEKINRVENLSNRHKLMQQVIEARAASPEMQEVPGGKTGLLVRKIKSIGYGATAEKVDEFAVDTGLVREMCQHEKQVAQELGQLTEKHEITGKDGAPLLKSDLADLSYEELLELAKKRGLR